MPLHAASTYPFALDKGWTTFAGWPTGSESRDELEDIPGEAHRGVGELRHAAQPHRPRRDANLLDVDLAKYAKEIQQLSALLDAADPDLSAFRRRGGKLIMKVNTTDYTVNPRWVMDYYDKVVADDGRRTRSTSSCASMWPSGCSTTATSAATR